MKWSVLIVMAVVMLSVGAALSRSWAVDDAAAAAERGPLAPVAFLAGTWRGTMDEREFVEEIWSEPSPGSGDTMMGVFRWLNAQGRPRMYEILTLAHEEGETILRLRHYTSAMVAWEEKDAPVTLRLAESAPERAAFANVSEEDRLSSVVFEREGNTLAIDVQFREGMGETLRFRLERVN